MTSGPKAGAEGTRLWYVYDACNPLVEVKNDTTLFTPRILTRREP